MEGEYSGSGTEEMRGVCEVDHFRGVSLSSIVYKVMCMILIVRLSTVAEEGLIAKEQGWFRKMRGCTVCRDQVLSIVLRGQMELKKSSGLMAFIDFSLIMTE